MVKSGAMKTGSPGIKPIRSTALGRSSTPSTPASGSVPHRPGSGTHTTCHSLTLAPSLMLEHIQSSGKWWHWSFGDRYWALVTGKSVACYGPKEITPLGQGLAVSD
ncbi:hypothetical protein GCM10010336_25430 [Streptomyces goshikiensis]|nr:hypothetical protein GCM10010336_25430 [Streptomyces goshikiensis]